MVRREVPGGHRLLLPLQPRYVWTATKRGDRLEITVDHQTRDTADTRLFNLQVIERDPDSLGVAAADITIATVPGALEAPLTLQAMAKSGRFDALVALGAVIRGETYHFELVSNEQGAGITRVTLDTGVPIANGILTTEDDDQALSRMQVKGADCAQAAVEMARLLKALA